MCGFKCTIGVCGSPDVCGHSLSPSRLRRTTALRGALPLSVTEKRENPDFRTESGLFSNNLKQNTLCPELPVRACFSSNATNPALSQRVSHPSQRESRFHGMFLIHHSGKRTVTACFSSITAKSELSQQISHKTATFYPCALRSACFCSAGVTHSRPLLRA